MKWFKRKSIPTTLNETTRLYSLYGESANLAYLDNKIDNLKNRVDNIPPSPNLDNYAKKNANNTFTANNTFNGDVQIASHLKGGWGSGILHITPEDRSNKTIKFAKQNYGRFNSIDLENTSKIINVPNPTNNNDAVNKQYVDTQTTTLTNNITANTNNINTLTTQVNQNLTEAKQYTDQEIAKIPSVDLSNVAKLNQNNTFTGWNQFNASTNFYAEVYMNNHTISGVKHPVLEDEAANKKYVDDKIHSRIAIDFIQDVSLTMEKTDLSSGVYFYKCNKQGLVIHRGGISPNSKYFILVYLEGLSSSSYRNDENWLFHTSIVNSDGFGNIVIEVPSLGNHYTFHTSTSDFNPGSAGGFVKNFRIRLFCVPA